MVESRDEEDDDFWSREKLVPGEDGGLAELSDIAIVTFSFQVGVVGVVVIKFNKYYVAVFLRERNIFKRWGGRFDSF